MHRDRYGTIGTRVSRENMSPGGQTIASDYPEEMEMDGLHDKEFIIRELQDNAETHLLCAKIYNKRLV